MRIRGRKEGRKEGREETLTYKTRQRQDKTKDNSYS